MGNPPELICFLRSFTFLLSFYSHFFLLLSPLLPEIALSLSFYALCSTLEEPSSPIFLFLEGLFFVRTTCLRACCRRALDIYYHHRTSSTASLGIAQYSTAQSTRTTSVKASPHRPEHPLPPVLCGMTITPFIAVCLLRESSPCFADRLPDHEHCSGNKSFNHSHGRTHS